MSKVAPHIMAVYKYGQRNSLNTDVLKQLKYNQSDKPEQKTRVWADRSVDFCVSSIQPVLCVPQLNSLPDELNTKIRSMTIAPVPQNICFPMLLGGNVVQVLFLHLSQALDFILTEIQCCLTLGLNSAASASHGSSL